MNQQKEKELQEIIIHLTKENISLKERLDKGNVDFCDFIESWLSKHKNKIRSDTYCGYCTHIYRNVVPYFKPIGLKLKDLRPSHFNDYFDYKLSCGYKEQTIKHHYSTIRCALNSAVKDGLMNSNPILLSDKPKVKKYNYEVLSFEELNQLFETLTDSSLYIPIVLTALLGLRRSEVVALKWESINFKHHSIKIENTYVESYNSFEKRKYKCYLNKTKSESSNREYVLPQKLEQALLNHRHIQFKNARLNKKYNPEYFDYVCTLSNGNLILPDKLSKHFRKIIKRLFPLKHIRFHDLRHSCGTFLHEKFNYDIKDIQSYLGHSNASFTANTYIHTTSERKAIICNSINENLIL